jgi:acyl dehydratase
MTTRTPTPTSSLPPTDDSWYFHSAYLEQRLREARFARSEAFGQLLADGWHALGRFVLGLLTNRKQPALRH